MREELTLATLCNGAINEKANRALQRCFDNILDPNTDPKKKREVNMRIILTPNANDVEDISVEVTTSVKLAPEMGIKTQFYIDKDLATGAIKAVEHTKGQIKGQLTLSDLGFTPEPQEPEDAKDDELETAQEPEKTSNIIDMRRLRNA